tara:strand:+ start:5732 stop:6211 length:480 start_codon:yes stop_codon:yes gene_type:complete
MKNFIKLLKLDLVPKVPLFLALGGVIPFIILSCGIWFFSYEIKLIALYNLLNYSVIIITFIGAIYWGVAMLNNERMVMPYFISIMPSLISWFMLMGFITNYLIILSCFIVIFAFIYFIDIKYTKRDFFPKWYMSLRKIVSFIVLLSLGFASFGVNIHNL